MNPTAVVTLGHVALDSFAAHHHLAIPRRGDTLTFGAERGRGGFATVTELNAINGQIPAQPMLVKVFDPHVLSDLGGPHVLVKRAGRLLGHLVSQPTHDWMDQLKAMPYCFADLVHEGQELLAAFMLDLAADGYESAPFAPREAARYRSRAITDRIDLAAQFASRCALLESLQFVHGDLNQENVLVSDRHHDVQIIDFDAGVIIEHGDERPLTVGKPDDCMPPELKCVAAGAPPASVDMFTPEAERWSVASVVGYFLFGAHPAFFLRAIAPTVIAEYAGSAHDWPDVDLNGPLATRLAPNRLAYRQLRADLAALPAGVIERFRQLFDAGLEGNLRPTAQDWRDALRALQAPPAVDLVVVNHVAVPAGAEIELSWITRNATHVEIPGVGRRPAVGGIRLPVYTTTRVQVVAVNPYGIDSRDSELIEAVPPPRVPRPDLTLIPTVRLPRVARPPFLTTPSSHLRPAPPFIASDHRPSTHREHT